MSSQTPRKDQLKIAIIGAGISGLALAIGLIKRQVACIIYEASSDFSAIGAGIGLGPNSLAAMDLIDPSFRSRYDNVRTTNEREEFKNSIFDALYAEEGLGTKWGWQRGLVGAPYFERSSAHRKELLEIMAGFIPPEVVRFSKKALVITQVEERVIIEFTDGESVSVDTVIGADGIRGITRKAIPNNDDPELVSPMYTGTYAYRGVIPMTDVKEVLGEHGGDAKWFMGHGKGLTIYPISKGLLENVVFFVKDRHGVWEDDRGANLACSKAEMLADLADFDARLKRLLDWAQPLKWPLFHHPTTPTYYKGNICMIGDVAHAMTPYQAAGAGQGLEDAAILAPLLAMVQRPDEWEAAFRLYDEIRRPRAARAVQTSMAAGVMYTFGDAELGDDLQRIVDNANERMHWLWQYDVAAEVQRVQAQFLALLAHLRTSENVDASVSRVEM